MKVGGNAIYEKLRSMKQVNRGNGLFTIHSMTIRTSILKAMHVGLQTHTFYVACEYMMFPVAWIRSVMFLRDKVYRYARDNVGQSVDVQN